MADRETGFGKFLVDRGEVTASDVVEALQHQRELQAPFGCIAVADGLLDWEQVFEILNIQRVAKHELFGELAVQLGYMSYREMLDILEHQYLSRPPLGEILVSRGTIREARLPALLEAYGATADATT